MKRFLIVVFFTVMNSLILKAQDVHYSLFSTNPVYLSPSYTGTFDGTARAQINYRNHWSDFGGPFAAASASVETRIANSENSGHLGIGLLIHQDESPGRTIILKEVKGLISYVLPLSDQFAMGAGIGIGYGMRQLRHDNFTFEHQYDGLKYNADFESGEILKRDNIGYMDISGGLSVTYADDDNVITSSFSMDHINKPDISFLSEKELNMYQKFIFSVRGDRTLSNKLKVSPGLALISQGQFRQISIGGQVGYMAWNDGGNGVFAGVWGRMLTNQAIIGSLGYQMNRLYVGICYDLSMSPVNETPGYYRAAEINLSYVFVKLKRAKSRFTKDSNPAFF